MVVPFSSAFTESSLNDGLVGYYTFDDNNGTVASESVSGKNMELFNGLTWQSSGKINSGIGEFDGTDDYMATSNPEYYNFSYIDSFSYCYWRYGTVSAPEQHIISKTYSNGNTGFEIVEYSSAIYIEINQPNTATGSIINLGEWQYFCITYNGTQQKEGFAVYLNGVSQALSGSGGISDFTTISNFTIGAGLDGVNYNSRGYIDELGIWNRTLNETEVNYLYNSGNGTAYEPVLDISPPYFTTIPANLETSYGTSVSVQFEAVDDIETVSYYVNDTNQFSISSSGLLTNATSLGVGLYILNITISDGVNYNSTLWQLNVTQITPNFTILLNGQANNLTLNYTTDLIINASSFDGVMIDLYRDGVAVPSENGQDIKLSAGTYIYSANFSGNQNYSATGTIHRQVIINQFVPNLIFLLNDGTSNLTLTFPALINASAFDGVSMDLYRDGVAVPLENGHFVSVIYNGTNETIIYSANFTGNENFTAVATQYKQVDVNTEAPTPTPTITGNTIYDVLSGAGAGLGKLLLYLAQALPYLLIGLGLVLIIVIIGQGFADLIKNFKWGNKNGI